MLENTKCSSQNMCFLLSRVSKLFKSRNPYHKRKAGTVENGTQIPQFRGKIPRLRPPKPKLGAAIPGDGRIRYRLRRCSWPLDALQPHSPTGRRRSRHPNDRRERSLPIRPRFLQLGQTCGIARHQRGKSGV